LAILFLGGVQSLCLGILGQYIARIYREVKNRPLYLVAATANLPGNHTDTIRPRPSDRSPQPALEPEQVRR
jgi:dolichol-phosphate mannosyltransferase